MLEVELREHTAILGERVVISLLTNRGAFGDPASSKLTALSLRAVSIDDRCVLLSLDAIKTSDSTFV